MRFPRTLPAQLDARFHAAIEAGMDEQSALAAHTRIEDLEWMEYKTTAGQRLDYLPELTPSDGLQDDRPRSRRELWAQRAMLHGRDPADFNALWLGQYAVLHQYWNGVVFAGNFLTHDEIPGNIGAALLDRDRPEMQAIVRDAWTVHGQSVGLPAPTISDALEDLVPYLAIEPGAAPPSDYQQILASFLAQAVLSGMPPDVVDSHRAAFDDIQRHPTPATELLQRLVAHLRVGRSAVGVTPVRDRQRVWTRRLRMPDPADTSSATGEHFARDPRPAKLGSCIDRAAARARAADLDSSFAGVSRAVLDPFLGAVGEPIGSARWAAANWMDDFIAELLDNPDEAIAALSAATRDDHIKDDLQPSVLAGEGPGQRRLALSGRLLLRLDAVLAMSDEHLWGHGQHATSKAAALVAFLAWAAATEQAAAADDDDPAAKAAVLPQLRLRALVALVAAGTRAYKRLRSSDAHASGVQVLMLLEEIVGRHAQAGDLDGRLWLRAGSVEGTVRSTLLALVRDAGVIQAGPGSRGPTLVDPHSRDGQLLARLAGLLGEGAAA